LHFGANFNPKPGTFGKFEGRNTTRKIDEIKDTV
jgi:hypothetical protein